MRRNASLEVSLAALLLGAALQLGCGDTTQDSPGTDGTDEVSMQQAHRNGGDVNGADEEKKVAICHVPPGNPENAHTITIGESAVDAHLRNHPGDSIGPCKRKVVECKVVCECNDDHKDSYSAAWDDEEEDKCECECKEVCEEKEVDGYGASGSSGDDKKDNGNGNGDNEKKVTICHVPPGNPENAHTITIGESAVDAHLRNHEGDHLGPCEKDEECKLVCECKKEDDNDNKDGGYGATWDDEEEDNKCECECRKVCEPND